ncbi:autotransporter outer membrane beta-barrel domain-containing protein [Parasphingopyxis marina]|uniref:Autotransporter domain-containing protein n=1 Tax=Parasphingopyxis marina TaxID=2761622 RepID=A0A842HW45_9SPHN|nr:autotransporter outer membrane beta-barrel domain-containing protein [Parasphingopyxis marina]MBC2776647.1 autotransporter domain-containing protein [Parasphingopyxis marina]
MRKLLCCTCLTPVAILAAPVHAETVIDTTVTTPVRTSTVDEGAPDDIRIGTNGKLTPNGGNAITLDSNNDVVVQGAVVIEDANNATGIVITGNRTGTVSNRGKITINEDYEVEDEDDDGDDDGPFAEGENRFGIRLAETATLHGTVANSGTIGIEGNRSAGIALDGLLDGSLSHTGTITVVGDDSQGIRTADVTGNITAAGGIAVQGENAIALDVAGDVGGRLLIQNSIVATGYRYISPPKDTDDLDEDDLLQGGPAVRIAGNVGGGILIDRRPPVDADTEDDEDNDGDGLPDIGEKTADIVSYGAAPGVLIGSETDDIAIGAVAGGSGRGLVIRGGVAGLGTYEDVAAQGLVIGGLGGDVSIAGGLGISGTVRAIALGAEATALQLGAGVTTGDIANSGRIAASGGGVAGEAVRAIAIEQGASLSEISNSGTIEAGANGKADAYAIQDRSGTLDRVLNDGSIVARGSTSGDSVAIDLSANAGGALVRQSAREENGRARLIEGDVRFGGGADRFEIAGGTVAGNTTMGAGNDALTLSGESLYTGNADLGAGDDMVSVAGKSRFTGNIAFGSGANGLTLAGDAVFRGAISHAGTLDVSVQGGTLDVTNTGAVALNSLTVGSGGTIAATIDTANDSNTLYDVAGTAQFADDSVLAIRLTGAGASEGDFVVVRAGTLVGGDALAGETPDLPFLFDGEILVDQANGEVSVSIARKSVEALELNGSQARAFDAVFDALDNDAEVAAAFLAITDGDAFRQSLRQMLPDHAGGTFESASQASRATARYLDDPSAPFADMGGWGYWVQQVAWGTSSDYGDTAAYDVSGWGVNTGAEFMLGPHAAIGGSLSYMLGKIDDEGTANGVDSDHFEAALFLRGQWGGWRANARASAAHIEFDGTRRFTGSADGEAIERTASGSWNGRLYSASGGVSYEFGSGRLRLRPGVSLDYYRLREGGYAETGGGEAFNLTVDSRTSDELAATARLAVGLQFGDEDRRSDWFLVEADGGRRQILGGTIASTTARFEGGEDFTLIPEQRTDGWIGALRLVGGNGGFSLGGEVNAEEQQGRFAYGARATLRIGF